MQDIVHRGLYVADSRGCQHMSLFYDNGDNGDCGAATRKAFAPLLCHDAGRPLNALFCEVDAYGSLRTFQGKQLCAVVAMKYTDADLISRLTRHSCHFRTIVEKGGQRRSDRRKSP